MIQTFFLDLNRKYFAIRSVTEQPSDSIVNTFVTRMLNTTTIQDEIDDAVRMKRDIVMNDQDVIENSP